MRTPLFVLWLGLAGASQLDAQAASPRQLIADALTAIGGADAARGLHTLSAESFTMAFGIGQEYTPDAPPSVSGRFATIESDWDTGRSALRGEWRGVTLAKVRQAFWPEGGFFEAPGGFTPAPAAQITAAQRSLRQSPQRLLLAALDSGAQLTPLPARAREGRRLIGARVEAAQDTAGLWFDPSTHRLAGIESWADDPILGDREIYVSIDRWGPAGSTGLLVPYETRTFLNGRLASSNALSVVRANLPIDSTLFSYPDSLRPQVVRAGAAQSAGSVLVRLDSLAPGVLHVTGGSHNSLALVQGDSTILVEAPLSTPRVRAILDTLAARYPRSPVRLAVLSHHHWDHSGGVRAALGAGIPVLTHEGNVAFVRRVGAARRTLAPDGVERNARRHVVRGMRDSLAIGSGAQQVVLYEVPNSHAAGLLAAYVPAAKLLFVADLAPRGTPLEQRELLDFVRSRGLAVERIAGAHGPVMPFADFERATLATNR